MDVIKFVKDETVPRDDVYKSHQVSVPSGDPAGSSSWPPAARKAGVAKPIGQGKLLRPGGPGQSTAAVPLTTSVSPIVADVDTQPRPKPTPKPTPAARALPGASTSTSSRLPSAPPAAAGLAGRAAPPPPGRPSLPPPVPAAPSVPCCKACAHREA